MRASLVAAFVTLGMTLIAAASAESLQDDMQVLLDQFRADYALPGMTAAIALPDGQVVSVASGLADLEAGTPMTPETRMLAASIGKMFVALTALSLEDDGVLQRSDLVADYLGSREWFSRLPNHTTMTVGNLLRHEAGLPDHVHLASFHTAMAARISEGSAAIAPEEAIAFVIGADALFPAGAGWAYTDTGYLLLGLVIEKAAGTGYYDLVTDRLLVPNGLNATTPSDTTTLPGLAVGYVAEDNPFGLPARTMDDGGRLLWNPATEWTGGGLASTSRDLAAWGHALFTGRALATPYLDRLLDSIPVSPDAPELRYGAGVAIYADTPRGPVYGHAGWIPGYVSSLRHYPDHGVTVAFQINTDVGTADDSNDPVPALEAALADLAVAATHSEVLPISLE